MHAANATQPNSCAGLGVPDSYPAQSASFGPNEATLPLKRLPICRFKQAGKLEARAAGAGPLERTAVEANIDSAGGNASAAGPQRKKKVVRRRLVREKSKTRRDII